MNETAGDGSARSYPVPADEALRLRELQRHQLLDQAGDHHFDRIVKLASAIFDMPIALISLVDHNRQWFLSREGLEVSETPREVAFCAHTIASDEVMVVPDALNDERFSGNPLVVSGPGIRFYAGAPLRTKDGHNLGTLCVIDQKPREFSPEQVQQLRLLAEVVMREIEWRHDSSLCPVTGLSNRGALFSVGQWEMEDARAAAEPMALICLDIDNFRQINNRWGHPAGDQVLLDFSHLCKGFLREQDFIARLGDEEFVILLIDQGGDAALQLAERIRQATSRMGGVFSRSGYHLSVSGGVSALGHDDTDFGDLVQRAERALELAKTNGRNQIASVLGS
ncbi:sensor domain-containing diguanylate cyclase [Synechococcus sp. RedBA-s]|uniref:sensor domain-containing diguanylate cyclase n=1 Tax=Synechococcus sp. RedBA-s TaxID=2823741 RepID=UPI0020CFC134|nr:sensor domain-containing diguanylate cyclase [Synechococcus sp. RedBA-s]MCP9799354.1 sensor domain-containing diguanylate cyclase [Synechococcus sp. RedBA-s]